MLPPIFALSTIFAQQLPIAQTQPAAPSLFSSLMPFLLIIVVMYFFMIRPQQKRQKAHRMLIENLKTGDDIVTSGGLYGTVAGIDEKKSTLWIKIAENVKIKIDRGSVSRVISEEEK